MYNYYILISTLNIIMDLSFLKNPIILTILAVALTYLYLYWDMKNKQKKNPKIIIDSPGFIIPLGVGVFTFLITYKLFGFPGSNTNISMPESNVVPVGIKPKLLDGGSLILGKNNISEKLTEGFDSNSYHLVGKGSIRLPQTDVFIDLAKF